MAVGGCTFSSDDIVIKSPTDRRLYRYIRLQNGLCALLVHDPDIYSDEPHSKIAGGREDEEDEEEEDDEDSEDDEDEDDDSDDDEEESEDDGNQVKVKGTRGASQTKKAAAAMCVGIGSFTDPLEAQGLAHFLEHMLFMGSSDFPDENERWSIPATILKLNGSSLRVP